MKFREKLSRYLSQRDRGWIFSLFAAVCLVYLPFLGNPFIFDDVPFFSGISGDDEVTFSFDYGLRSLSYASLRWTYTIFSDVFPHWYHLGNMLVHAASVIATFYLLRQLVIAVISDSKNDSRVVWGAWLGAIVFAVHPVAVYAVGYVIQHSILMATLFVLLMQLAYLRGLLTGRKRWLLLTVIAYFLAGISKEHSLLAPALLAAETILLRGHIKASMRVLWLTWIALVAIGVQIILLAKGVVGVPYETMSGNLFEQQGIVESTTVQQVLSALTQAGLFFKYLWLWLLPNPAWMSADMRVPFVSSLGAWQGWLGAMAYIAYGTLAGWLLLRPRLAGLAGLALLYPWLQFAIEFSTIRVQEPFVLYRSYLWMPGMLLFIPMLLAKWPSKNTIFALGMAALLMVPLSWNRLWVFGDNYRLWNDAAALLTSEQEPGADRIFYNRGISASRDKPEGEAIADLERSVALSPKLAPIHHALGIQYLNAARLEDAMAQFDASLAIDPKNAKTYYAKGITFKRLHKDKEALEQMRISCELKEFTACILLEMVKAKR